MEPFDSSEHVFNITVGLLKCSIWISTNSSICEYNFNATSKQLSFKVAGIEGTAGFCNISIPAVLMSGDFTVFKDDAQLVSGVDYTQTLTKNGTYYLFMRKPVEMSPAFTLFSSGMIRSDSTSIEISPAKPPFFL